MRKSIVCLVLSASLLVVPQPSHAIFGFLAAIASAFIAGTAAFVGSFFGGGRYEQRRNDYYDSSEYGSSEPSRGNSGQQYGDSRGHLTGSRSGAQYLREEPKALRHYIKAKDYDYEVRYFLSRLLDLAMSQEPDHVAVKAFLSDKIAIKFLEIISSPNIDFTPLLEHVTFYNKLQEKAGERSPTEFVREGVRTAFDGSGFSLAYLVELARIGELEIFLDRISYSHLGQLKDRATKFFDYMGLSVKAVTQGLNDPTVGFQADTNRIVRNMQTIIVKYFEAMPPEEQARLNHEFQQLMNPTQVDVMAFGLLHSGPAMVKLVQLMYQNIQSPALKAALKQAEENLTPMPYPLVKEIVTTELKSVGVSFDDLFVKFDEEPVLSREGKRLAATVGQVHEAVIRYKDKSGRTRTKVVAVKVRRRDFMVRLETDIVRTRTAGLEEAFGGGIFGQLIESMRREGDFRIEAQNIDAGQVYDQPERSVGVVKRALPDQLPATESLLIMDFVRGGYSVGDAQRVAPSELRARGQALENLYTVWLNNALIGNGFIHGDPNGGNAKVTNGGEKAVFLDFGNVAQLSHATQRQLAQLAVAVATNDGAKAEVVLDQLLPGFAQTPAGPQFHAIREALGMTDVSEVMGHFFEFAVTNNATVPIPLAQFLRGMLLFKNQFAFLAEQMNVKPAGRKAVALQHKSFDQITAEILQQAVLQELALSDRGQASSSGRVDQAPRAAKGNDTRSPGDGADDCDSLLM